ncbi:hypothetical protein B4110_2729 [Parageobacillus toebii]|uniref:Uncharacterized protein n=1 Tax=Parageobacillus toebii TaxID=153151 RepID=A0A150N8E0_9BACL|nr:hypothetical protein B4110_2729 [Parageobacillus toebii]
MINQGQRWQDDGGERTWQTLNLQLNVQKQVKNVALITLQ